MWGRFLCRAQRRLSTSRAVCLDCSSLPRCLALMDAEKVRSLVQLYEQKRLLWDPQEKDYHNKNLREDAWKVISNEIGISVAELKKKMTALMGSFRREKSREKKSLVTGSGQEDVYQSKWFAYTWFGFLADKNKPGETRDTMSQEDPNTSPVSESTVENAQYTREEPLPSCSEPSVTPSVKKSCVTPQAFRRKKRCAARDDDVMLKNAYDILLKSAEIPSDPYVSFGQHVANEMRKYDPITLAHVKRQISNILFEADLGSYRSTCEGYSTGHTYPSSMTPVTTASSTPPEYYAQQTSSLGPELTPSDTFSREMFNSLTETHE